MGRQYKTQKLDKYIQGFTKNYDKTILNNRRCIFSASLEIKLPMLWLLFLRDVIVCCFILFFGVFFLNSKYCAFVVWMVMVKWESGVGEWVEKLGELEARMGWEELESGIGVG